MAAEPHSARSRVVDRRIALAREWDELVSLARRLGPEFTDFLAPPVLDSLIPRTGTVAVINISSLRCDALLVSAAGVEAVALPDLTAEEVVDRVVAHIARFQDVDAAADRVNHTESRARVRPVAANFQAHHKAKVTLNQAQADLDAKLLLDLEWLWETTAGPVLGALGVDGSADRRENRIWWCPTGPLGFLPLHAAGHHDGSGRAVIDRAVSSSTPTLRALARAVRPSSPGGPGRMLVVAVDDLADHPPLPQSAVELELLREIFPAERLTVLEGEAATRDAVLAELPHHRWAHFSCHGRQDVLNPSQGGLLLRDGTLTVTDLSRGRYDGEFGFLSACMTATGGLSLSEEIITLGAGLHYAGFRHVLATLWSVDAEIATDLANEIFPSLVVDGRFDPDRSAAAANDAVLQLRDADPTRPSRWAPFTHTGP